MTPPWLRGTPAGGGSAPSRHGATLYTLETGGVLVESGPYRAYYADMSAARAALGGEWSGHPDPEDPDTFWIDDATGQRVRAE